MLSIRAVRIRTKKRIQREFPSLESICEPPERARDNRVICPPESNLVELRQGESLGLAGSELGVRGQEPSDPGPALARAVGVTGREPYILWDTNDLVEREKNNIDAIHLLES